MKTTQTHIGDLQRNAARAFATLPAAVTELGTVFAAAGQEIALVGGPVRDALLGRPLTDLDFATSAPPPVTEKLLRQWGDAVWDVGRAFGTIGATRYDEDLKVEVTTYRADTYDPASRKPAVTFGTHLAGDLARRDFTVNAMALRLPDLEFVDQFDSLVDLAYGRLRTPIEPEQSFGDDPLRMMRAVRFVSQLGFTIVPQTAEAMLALAQRIEIVSAERVREELVRLLMGTHVRDGLEAFVDSGLAEHVLPELVALQLEIDEHHHHKDVYQHTLTVVDQAIELETEPDLVLRLAALLHDIGKPATRRFLPGGGVSFYHHDVVGAKLTRARLGALRFDKETTAAVARLVELHLRFHGYMDAGWSDAAVRRYVADAGPLLARLHRLTRADCTTRNRRRAAQLSHAYDDLERRIAELSAAEELAAIRPDLDGNQIQQILGIGPGRDVGRAYKFLLELRLERGPLGVEDATAALRQWWECAQTSPLPGRK